MRSLVKQGYNCRSRLSDGTLRSCATEPALICIELVRFMFGEVDEKVAGLSMTDTERGHL